MTRNTPAPSRRRTRLGAPAAAAVLALTAWPAAAVDYPTGPDVASYQHPGGAAIDWAAVKADGRSFAFVKATEGVSYTNPYFPGDWAGARAAGLYRGAYHFARPDTGTGTDAELLADAEAEAAHFVGVVGAVDQPGDLPPVLDLERAGTLTPARLATWTATFLTAVQEATGRTPIVYTGPDFWASSMGGSAAFTGYPLWIAHTGATTPRITPWTTWTFWQYAHDGTVAGISTAGDTDVNRFNGTPADLARLALVPVNAPTLTLAGPARPVPYGGGATLSGKLRRADGTAAAGTQVKLYRRLAGESSAHFIAAVTTGADGSYRYTFSPTAGQKVSARSTAKSLGAVAESPVVDVRVAAVVHARWSDSTPRAGNTVTLRGSVSPHPSGTVVVRQVFDGKQWTTVGTRRVGSDGRFAFEFRAKSSTPGTQRVVATAPGYVPGTDTLPRLRVS